ncbi:hypothetical protein LCGC14_1343730 [marine sediment metagenome]|uniref:HNH nuclease domain-containing protein n=1 Tax=marine sediment metagenome TaxID=412755 RepID=A0A0F9KDL0_9ZZZZ
MVVPKIDRSRDAYTPGSPTPKGVLSMLDQHTTFLFGDPRLPVRFWAKVRIGSTPTQRPDLGPCWEWTGARRKGYGQLWHEGRAVSAHRLAYECLSGVVPPGLQLDHLCRIRHCANPGHVEAVTGLENTRRGDTGVHKSSLTHCPQGHPYAGENLYICPAGFRECRECKRESVRRWRAEGA